jgi:hypothetical protein
MNQSEVMAEYLVLRAAGKRVSHPLVESLSRDDLKTAARLLGRLQGENTFVFESEDETSVLMDYGIHEIFHDGLNAVGRMLRNNPPPEGSPELRSLQAQSRAHYTILQVIKVMPKFGVLALDQFRDKEVVIVDVGFGQTAEVGMQFASRIYSPALEWWMTGGASLPITPAAAGEIIAAERAYIERHGRAPLGPDRSLLTIRACLKAGASQQVRYANPGENVNAVRGELSEPVRPIRALNKVGRNDPCPCGSGKKYKKCCGR